MERAPASAGRSGPPPSRPRRRTRPRGRRAPPLAGRGRVRCRGGRAGSRRPTEARSCDGFAWKSGIVGGVPPAEGRQKVLVGDDGGPVESPCAEAAVEDAGPVPELALAALV